MPSHNGREKLFFFFNAVFVRNVLVRAIGGWKRAVFYLFMPIM